MMRSDGDVEKILGVALGPVETSRRNKFNYRLAGCNWKSGGRKKRAILLFAFRGKKSVRVTREQTSFMLSQEGLGLNASATSLVNVRPAGISLVSGAGRLKVAAKGVSANGTIISLG